MKYKNISNRDLAIPNLGVVKAGETFESKDEIKNRNFEEVKEEKLGEKKTKK